jgi:hypothetical protein
MIYKLEYLEQYSLEDLLMIIRTPTGYSSVCRSAAAQEYIMRTEHEFAGDSPSTDSDN